MKIGLFAALANPMATPSFITALGRGAEERGFNSLWVAEHVVLFDEYESRYPYRSDGRIPAGPETGILEPLTTLSFLAAVTTRVRLGTGVCLVPQRNPVYTAKEVANVDWLSGGRVDFGIGVGWLAEEFRAVDVPFEHRGARCSEYVQVMRRLWEDPVSEHHGRFYDLPPCRQYPKPVQQPHPPIFVGGESEAALRRVAEFAQGWFPFNTTPAALAALLPRLDRHLAEKGRSRNELRLIVGPEDGTVTPDDVGRYAELGVEEIIVRSTARDEASMRGRLDELAAATVEPAGRV